MRLVLDTAVMVAALRSEAGASRRLLLMALESQFSTLASVPLFLEYEAVLTRVEHLAAARATREDVLAILDAVAAVTTPVELSFRWRPTLRDPDDDMVLETAANGRADAIVTFNQRDFSLAHRFGVLVWTPGAALLAME